MDIFSLFDLVIERGASDLHIVSDYYPAIRINNNLVQLRAFELTTPEKAKELLLSILTEEQKDNLLSNKEMDFGYEYKDVRFRANIYFARGQLAGAFRTIDKQIKTIEELNLPASFHDFTAYRTGLVLITGPTGEGKSTTLASIIQEINLKYEKHIITIEDPIEFVYQQGRSVISQRELHQDTHSWNIALRSVLREDPDIVLIGEMRDHETIQSVLTIAETGHLVFSTLHTSTASETINRIIDVFPPDQQTQIRTQLASVLRAVVAERLIPTIDNINRIPAVEVLINTPSVAAVIRDSRTYTLDNSIETGQNEGQLLLERYLASLYEKGRISRDDALLYALRPNEIKKFIK